MDTLQIAWAAGFLDGEGTITIKRYHSYKGQSLRYQAYISCGQVDKPENAKAIELLKFLFGGSVSRYTQTTKKDVWLNTVSWAVVSNDAFKCAEIITPYLKIKHRQAKLLMKFHKDMTREKGRKRLTERELKKRDDYWWAMRQFNVKGNLRLQRLNEGTPKGDVIV